MKSTPTSSLYTAEIISDPALNIEVIALSYTDPRNPTHNMLACIAPALGSNWYRWRVGEHELIHCEAEGLKKSAYTGVFVLWPFPNRVRDFQYTYHGQRYTFANIKRPANVGPLVHGLVYDQPWSHTPPVVDQQGASVTTFIEIDAGHPCYEAYPFASRLALTYVLTSTGMTVTYTVQNKGEHTLPYGFGLHPCFTMPSGSERTLVTLPAAQVMEADSQLLPTGQLLDVHSTMYAMFDLNQPRAVGQLKLDHVYTNLPTLREAVIEHRDLNLRLRITASHDFTHSVIYTLAWQPYICLENQTCSTDAVNLARRGMQDIAHLLEVQPGQEMSGSLCYEIQRG